MRLFAIAFLVLTLVAGPALAQYGGHIGLYSDPTYFDCSLHEMLYVSNTVYVVHEFAPSGNTAQFRIINHWPGPAPGIIDWGTNLTLGDVYTGIAVTYVGCKALPYLLGTLSFIPTAATPPCTATLRVGADLAVASGFVEVVDCNMNVLLATGGELIINGNTAECPCILDPVGTAQSNWSRVKALYR